MRKFNTCDIVRHFKGDLYMILGQGKHTETGEQLMFYKALYGDGTMYARPLEMFLEEVPKDKVNPTGQKYRFELHKPISVAFENSLKNNQKNY